MSLPIVRGALVFYTQRVDRRPYVNCMMYSLSTVLRWMGYDCPADYGMQLRIASGRPIYNDSGEATGTTTLDSRKAIQKLLPEASVMFVDLSEADLWRMLPWEGGRGRNKAVIRIALAMDERLPRYLRRWCGRTWVGGHAGTFAAKRVCDGESSEGPRHEGHRDELEVFWMDPMGYGDYVGEWAPLDAFRDNLGRAPGGKVRSAVGFKNTAA